MRHRCGLLIVLGLAAPAWAGNPPPPGDLDGTWDEVVYRPTREEHPAPLAPRDPTTLVVRGHAYTVGHGDRPVRQSLVKSVPGQTPKAIDLMTVVGGDEFWLTRAIYAIDGDTLTICEGGRNADRPTEFRRWRDVRDPHTALTTYKRRPPPPKVEVGAKAPAVDLVRPDGGPVELSELAGKVVLLTFWTADDAARERHFAAVRAVRRAFPADRLQVVTARVDGRRFDDWLAFLDRQPPPDPDRPGRAFADDPGWWQVFHQTLALEDRPRNPYGVRAGPESYLIGPDGRLVGVRVPDAELARTVRAALKAIE